MRTALNGSQTVVYAALDPKVANTNGLYYKYAQITNRKCQMSIDWIEFLVFRDLEKVKVPDAARDGEMGLWLWKASENWASLSATDVIGQINEKRNAWNVVKYLEIKSNNVYIESKKKNWVCVFAEWHCLSYIYRYVWCTRIGSYSSTGMYATAFRYTHSHSFTHRCVSVTQNNNKNANNESKNIQLVSLPAAAAATAAVSARRCVYLDITVYTYEIWINQQNTNLQNSECRACVYTVQCVHLIFLNRNCREIKKIASFWSVHIPLVRTSNMCCSVCVCMALTPMWSTSSLYHHIYR